MKIKLGQPSPVSRYFIYSAVLLYLFLCVLHLASRRMPWLDEIWLINNLKELSPGQVFGPLKHSQGFPRLYLLFIQNLSRAFNYNVLSLRILPFVFMTTGFGLWLAAFRKQEGRTEGYLLFILCWCGSWFMSYYAAEFKQYSADVFSAAVFTYFLLKQKEPAVFSRPKAGLILQYLLLPLLLLFSYAGYFFILLPAYNLLLLSLKERRNVIYLAVYLSSAATVSFISYNSDLKYTLATAGLHNYWKEYFISTSSLSGFLTTFWEGLRNIFVRWFMQERPFTWIMTIFMPFAVYYAVLRGIKQFRADSGLCVSLVSLTVALLTALFAAGVLQFFPFTATRLTLFIAPFIFYSIIKSIEMFRARFFALSAVLSGIFIFTLLSISIRLISTYLRGY